MFGNLGNIANLIKQASAMKANMAKLQEELNQRTFDAESGAGLVKAKVNGKGELIDIKIDPEAARDIELLEDLVKGAVAAAGRKAQEQVKSDLKQMAGGIDIPGLEGMFEGGI